MLQPNLITHLIIILRARKPPPRSHQGNPMPLSAQPQALQACPNTLSVQPDRAWHKLNVHIVWVCPLPQFHPSAGWGSGLAREAVEGNWKLCRTTA